MPTVIQASDLKTHLSALLDRVEAGEDIIVTRNGRPAVLLSQVERPQIPFGYLKGLAVPEDLSVPDEVIDAFYATDLVKARAEK